VIAPPDPDVMQADAFGRPFNEVLSVLLLRIL